MKREELEMEQEAECHGLSHVQQRLQDYQRLLSSSRWTDLVESLAEAERT